jgi:hypothetical protein
MKVNIDEVMSKLSKVYLKSHEERIVELQQKNFSHCKPGIKKRLNRSRRKMIRKIKLHIKKEKEEVDREKKNDICCIFKNLIF